MTEAPKCEIDVHRWYYITPYVAFALLILVILPWGLWVSAIGLTNAARVDDLSSLRKELIEIRESLHEHTDRYQDLQALKERVKRNEGRLNTITTKVNRMGDWTPATKKPEQQ